MNTEDHELPKEYKNQIEGILFDSIKVHCEYVKNLVPGVQKEIPNYQAIYYEELKKVRMLLKAFTSIGLYLSNEITEAVDHFVSGKLSKREFYKFKKVFNDVEKKLNGKSSTDRKVLHFFREFVERILAKTFAEILRLL